MVIDSSALLAIVLAESDAAVYANAIARALETGSNPLCIPASVVVEAAIVAELRSRGKQLNALIDRMQPEIVPLDHTLAKLAVQTFRKFGRGRHRAALNFGDCLSYATAEHLRLPLLYKGDDFRRTGLLSAL
jgi:ribonuclease VapC